MFAPLVGSSLQLWIARLPEPLVTDWFGEASVQVRRLTAGIDAWSPVELPPVERLVMLGFLLVASSALMRAVIGRLGLDLSVGVRAPTTKAPSPVGPAETSSTEVDARRFQSKWRGVELNERAAAQEHYIDLCRLFGAPTPVEGDRKGTFYAFEHGAEKTEGGRGFADVWWRGKFAWEYKGPRANLHAAYLQLLQYREALENPPLLIVCDLHRFEIHTNFTGLAKRIYVFTIDDLDRQETFDLLRAVFEDPERLRPVDAEPGQVESGRRTAEPVRRSATWLRPAAAMLLVLGLGLAISTDGTLGEPWRTAMFLLLLLLAGVATWWLIQLQEDGNGVRSGPSRRTGG